MEFGQSYNVVVMYGKPYELKDDETKEVRRGLTVEYYFFGENGEALKSVADANAGTLGIRRSKCSLSAELQEKLVYVPGVYKGQFIMDVNADGKPSLKLTDIDFIGKCNITLENQVDADADASAVKSDADAAANASAVKSRK